MLSWISNSRVSLQRLGFCKFAVALNEGCRSRRDLADVVWPVLQKPITAPAKPELLEWLNSLPKREKNSTDNNQERIPKQYYWAFEHPSQRGLSMGAFAEYFDDIGMPFLLGLLDDECNRTDLGELLAVIQDRNNINLLWKPPRNPLILSKGDQTFFAFCLLKQDGDFLIPFMQALIKHFGENTFSYLEAGNIIPDVIEEILQRFAGAVYTSSDREEYLKLEAAKTEISKNIERKAETEGFGSRREQTAVPRLEWLADLGILDRKMGKKYRYILFPHSQRFVEELYSLYIDAADKGYVDEAVDKVLDTKFMQLIYRLVYEPVDDLTKISDIIQFLSPASDEFKSITGYCLIRPLLLLSHIRKWDVDEKCLLEYNQTIQALEAAYQQNPNRFYFTTTRFGEDYQIKFDNAS